MDSEGPEDHAEPLDKRIQAKILDNFYLLSFFGVYE
jgi:hypothetical protein